MCQLRVPKYLEAVQALKTKTPQTVRDVRRLLGFLSYYHSYIQDLSRIAKSVYKLLKVKTYTSAQQSHQPKIKGPQLSSKTLAEWTHEHQQVLKQLIDALIILPVLGYPDFNSPFSFHTDASEQGLGAVLYQQQSRKLRVIGYGSRKLSQAKGIGVLSGRKPFNWLKNR